MAGLQTAPAARPAVAAPRRLTGARLRRHLDALARHALLVFVSVVFMVPFYWMASGALKSNEEIFARPIMWWPSSLRWENFPNALTYPGFPFLRFAWNSVFYSGSVTVGTVLSCAAVGYGFARLRFPGRDLLFTITLSTMMIPSIVTFIPTYVLFKYLGLLGTYAPLVLPTFFGNAFFIFMLRQFYLGLPWELSEAAKVDGAGEFLIFWQIMLPLVRSALLVVAVFTFLWTWHDFFGPLIYLSDSRQYPLSLGLFAFRSRYATQWDLLMAAATLTTLPLVVLFFFAQRYFLEGVTLTGMKG
ncbi:MAG TPA: carbohydrate ABC transporter permease [Chloroflexota bacterium]|jgi:multiple sugar transport system permease protein|nr:carbohydrate ABC transporter permease [Chloroflexota bacterium]